MFNNGSNDADNLSRRMGQYFRGVPALPYCLYYNCVAFPMCPIEKVGTLVWFFAFLFLPGRSPFYLRFRPLRLLDDSQLSSFKGSIPAAPILEADPTNPTTMEYLGASRPTPPAVAQRHAPGYRCIQHKKSLRPWPSSTGLPALALHTDNRVTPASGAAISRCCTAGVTIEWRFRHNTSPGLGLLRALPATIE